MCDPRRDFTDGRQPLGLDQLDFGLLEFVKGRLQLFVLFFEFAPRATAVRP